MFEITIYQTRDAQDAKILILSALNLLNSLHASVGFSHRLMTYANSLDPDQAQHCVGPDLRSKLFDTMIVFLRKLGRKYLFYQNDADDNYLACKETQLIS